MFEQVFTDLAKRVPEIRMAGVWGTDGLELEKQVFSRLKVDVDFLGAEVADIITKINSIQPFPESARVRLDLEDGWLYVFRVTRDFFFILLTGRDAIDGRVNFYADISRARIAEML